MQIIGRMCSLKVSFLIHLHQTSETDGKADKNTLLDNLRRHADSRGHADLLAVKPV